MKQLPLPIALALTLALPAFSEPAPAPADIDQIVAAAATCQSGQSLEPFRRIEELLRQSLAEPAWRQPLEAGLIRLLGPDSTFEARRFACKQLAVIGSKSALPAIAKLLADDQTAGIACLALTTYPPGQADDILRAALPAAQGRARIQICNTLGDRRDTKSVKLLTTLAHDPDRPTAEAAIASLGKIGDREAWQAIASLRAATDPALAPVITDATLGCATSLAASGDRKTAIEIFSQLLAPAEAAYARRSAFAALVRLDKDQGEHRILSVIRSSDSVLKPAAIAAVRSLRSRGASEMFAAELPNLQPQDQVWLVDTLAARADAPARVAIQTTLASPKPAVRRAAIAALERMGDTSCVSPLARALANATDPDETRALESALAHLAGGMNTDKAIITELAQASPRARAGLLTALARREGPAANPMLFQETANPDPAVAKAAFRALGKTADGADAPALLAKLVEARDAEVRDAAESAAAQALARIADSSRRSAIVAEALDRSQTVQSRSSLLALLPGCGDPRALTMLKTATADTTAPVRDAAVRALAEWPDGSAWNTLAAISRQPENGALCSIALRALVRFASEENAHPTAQLLDRYQQLLDNARTDSERKLILGALAGAAHPDALQLALPLLTNPAVRPEAEVAIKKIAAAIEAQHPEAARAALRKLEPHP
jgi:HEAT repeat protein